MFRSKKKITFKLNHKVTSSYTVAEDRAHLIIKVCIQRVWSNQAQQQETNEHFFFPPQEHCGLTSSDSCLGDDFTDPFDVGVWKMDTRNVDNPIYNLWQNSNGHLQGL